VGAGNSRGTERNRHLDLLRPVAIGAVVYGHWLVAGLPYSHAVLQEEERFGEPLGDEGMHDRRVGVITRDARGHRPDKFGHTRPGQAGAIIGRAVTEIASSLLMAMRPHT
jgi:hypothetical protein